MRIASQSRKPVPDVAGIKTTAISDGDHYILNGGKTFITGATNANFYSVLANATDPDVREDRRARYRE
ncbi:MAG: acyl-CoA dehydrogenase family protein [Chloroflexota bacterium]